MTRWKQKHIYKNTTKQASFEIGPIKINKKYLMFQLSDDKPNQAWTNF